LIERRDAKAIQRTTGAYNPVRVDMRDTDSELIPWHVNDIVAHVEGKQTFGHYLVAPGTNTVRCFAFDIDILGKANPDIGETPITWKGEEINPRQVWLDGGNNECRNDIGRQLQAMAWGLAHYTTKGMGIKVLISYSGSKGIHVIGVLDEGTPAADARDAARRVLDATGVMMASKGDVFFRHVDAYPAIEVELFPKQDEVTADSFGNLMRLPLGVNQKVQSPGFFMKISRDLKVAPDDPMDALTLGSMR
jgi:hypothetical protein